MPQIREQTTLPRRLREPAAGEIHRPLDGREPATRPRPIREPAVLLGLLAVVWSCSAAPPPALPDPMAAVRGRLAQAAALTARGCYRCLVEARDLYDDLERRGAAPDAVAAGLFRTTLLMGMREREMGLPGGGTFERPAALAGVAVPVTGEAPAPRGIPEAATGEAGKTPEAAAGEAGEAAAGRAAAREIAAAGGTTAAGRTAAGATAAAGAAWDTFLQIAATTPWQEVGMPKDLAEENVYARAIADRDRDAWNAALRPLVPADPLAAYLYLGLNCTGDWLAGQPPELADVLAAHDDAVFVRYRHARCAGEQVALAAVPTIEPRFSEMEFFLGQHALAQEDAALAELHYRRAREAWPEWPAPALALGEVARIVEDYEASLPFYDAALALVPDQRDALLGKARSLSFLDRSAEALPLLDRLVEMGRWYLADAHFWRAWNHFNLEAVEAARADAARAIEQRPDAEAHTLSGQIAIEQGRLDDARRDLETALEIRELHCDAAFHLGRVHVQEARWFDTGSAFARASGCYAETVLRLEYALGRLREDPALSEERRARLVLRRTAELAVSRRQAASSAYNAALGYYNNGTPRPARRFAEQAQEHETFAERAARLLGLIENLGSGGGG